LLESFLPGGVVQAYTTRFFSAGDPLPMLEDAEIARVLRGFIRLCGVSREANRATWLQSELTKITKPENVPSDKACKLLSIAA
jgi:hypothetical protein